MDGKLKENFHSSGEIMTSSEKTDAFVTLGKFFAQFKVVSFLRNPELTELNNRFSENFENIIRKEHEFNPWFTPENVRRCLASLSESLTRENIRKWLSSYPEHEGKPGRELEVAAIMAGNIPLVGFHDFISVMFSGHRLLAKLSAKDDRLLPAVVDILKYLNSDFGRLVSFGKGTLKNPGAVIATGSNNSSRYFEYYFGKYPHIIRKNRNSAAVLSGSESNSDLQLLADDVFAYFGLGCRNVSKVYVPAGYEIPRLLDNFMHHDYLINHNKYANNYEYHRAIHLVNRDRFFDTGFLVVIENQGYSSPVGCLYFEQYENSGELRNRLETDRDKIQCIVGAGSGDMTAFGHTQTPMLWEYADNVDTLKFLLNLSEISDHGL